MKEHQWRGSHCFDRGHKDWTPEEDDELIDLVKEQELTLQHDPRLAWFRIGVQLDKIPWVCRRRWLGLRSRRHDVLLPLPYYKAADDADRFVLWLIGGNYEYVERPGI